LKEITVPTLLVRSLVERALPTLSGGDAPFGVKVQEQTVPALASARHPLSAARSSPANPPRTFSFSNSANFSAAPRALFLK
jgi:hypothetical protein